MIFCLFDLFEWMDGCYNVIYKSKRRVLSDVRENIVSNDFNEVFFYWEL